MESTGKSWILFLVFLIFFLIVQAAKIEVIDEDKIIKLIHDRYKNKDKILRFFYHF